MEKTVINVCTWVGDGECCRQPTQYGKSYCEKHYNRVYLPMPTEMADYIFDKELKNDK